MSILSITWLIISNLEFIYYRICVMRHYWFWWSWYYLINLLNNLLMNVFFFFKVFSITDYSILFILILIHLICIDFGMIWLKWWRSKSFFLIFFIFTYSKSAITIIFIVLISWTIRSSIIFIITIIALKFNLFLWLCLLIILSLTIILFLWFIVLFLIKFAHEFLNFIIVLQLEYHIFILEHIIQFFKFIIIILFLWLLLMSIDI